MITMNLTEIKNASRIELLDFLEGFGKDVDPTLSNKTTLSTKKLRDLCRDIYWMHFANNDGYARESYAY
jgi:hypothetical protein